MMRLIDAERLDAILASYKGHDKDSFIACMSAVIDAIKNAPTVDAVAVVRCKECKEWDEENHWCNIRDSYGWDYKPNDYCSYGVRKAGDDEAD